MDNKSTLAKKLIDKSLENCGNKLDSLYMAIESNKEPPKLTEEECKSIASDYYFEWSTLKWIFFSCRNHWFNIHKNTTSPENIVTIKINRERK